MGAYHSTLCVKKGNVNVGNFCAFENKSIAKGHHWDIHKGKLKLADSSELKKVVVKVCPVRQCSHEECQAEIQKMDYAEDVLQQCRDLNVLRLCRTYKTEVDEACTVFNIFSSNKHGAVIQEGTPVLIQDRVNGPIRTFFDFDEEPDIASDLCPCFLDFALASYRISGGTRVIAGIKGLVWSKNSRDADTGHRARTYLVTSLTVHSVGKEFGSKDRGVEGIQSFLRTLERAGITAPVPDGGRRRVPSAPPLDEADDVLTYGIDVNGDVPTYVHGITDDVQIHSKQEHLADTATLSPRSPSDKMSSGGSHFGFPPPYESVVLGMGWGRTTDLPPPYTETSSESVFLLGLASRAFAADVFRDTRSPPSFLGRSHVHC
ncbi:hypothetical protein BaRGS_00014932 [Batillaria attramentaria]|uniref:Uncharacterized protein n=1 Tax=Batillaria attramentaria TaxID=370345 RepID=A0ABD0L3G4_9CAEN